MYGLAGNWESQLLCHSKLPEQAYSYPDSCRGINCSLLIPLCNSKSQWQIRTPDCSSKLSRGEVEHLVMSDTRWHWAVSQRQQRGYLTALPASWYSPPLPTAVHQGRECNTPGAILHVIRCCYRTPLSIYKQGQFSLTLCRFKSYDSNWCTPTIGAVQLFSLSYTTSYILVSIYHNVPYQYRVFITHFYPSTKTLLNLH